MKKAFILMLASMSFVGLTASAQIGVGTDVDVDVGSKVKVETKVNVSATSKGNTVNTSASSVKSWDNEEKKEFLTSVKTHAELKSEQDLDNFAKGVMIKDENVTTVNADDDLVEVRYKLPAKFLGIFSADINAITNVTFETEKTGRGPKEVTVKFPWYSRFFSISSSTRAEVLKAAIDESVQIYAQTPRDNSYAQNGVTINLISNVLKNIRASIKASAEAKTN